MQQRSPTNPLNDLPDADEMYVHVIEAVAAAHLLYDLFPNKEAIRPLYQYLIGSLDEIQSVLAILTRQG